MQVSPCERPTMSPIDFLSFVPDFSSPDVVRAYDEAPLWSAMFGLLMLEEVPFNGVRDLLDVGCGTGFPLLELAERLGPASNAHGVDSWAGGLSRASDKVSVRASSNVTLHEADAADMPFPDQTFDLIVSNLGLNNFDNPAAAVAECRRVARPASVIALTTNLQGHMHELYEAFRQVLEAASDHDALLRLSDHAGHRATVAGVKTLLEGNGYSVRRVVQRESVMRFADGTALFNHYFIKLGFLDGWKKIVPDREAEVLPRVLARLDTDARQNGELRLTIPMAYIEAIAV